MILPLVQCKLPAVGRDKVTSLVIRHCRKAVPAAEPGKPAGCLLVCGDATGAFRIQFSLLSQTNLPACSVCSLLGGYGVRIWTASHDCFTESS